MNKNYGVYYVNTFNGNKESRFAKALDKADAEKKMKYILTDINVTQAEVIEY